MVGRLILGQCLVFDGNPRRDGPAALRHIAQGAVLVRDGLYDEAFVRAHTFGFEGWTDAAGGAHRGGAPRPHAPALEGG